ERVDLEVVPRIRDGGGHGDLGGEVHDRGRVAVLAEDLRQRVEGTDVLAIKGELALSLEPLEVFVATAPRQIVDDDDLLAALDPARRRVASDEASAPGQDDLHALAFVIFRPGDVHYPRDFRALSSSKKSR